MSQVLLPPAWVEQVSSYPADGGKTGADWVRTVPRLLDAALDRWELVVDGAPRTGWTAVVVPVRQEGRPLALKITWPHSEGRLEHLALRTWAGRGAVTLVAALPSEGLLLLERLDADTDLREVWSDEACQVVGGLLGVLDVPAPPPVERLADHLHRHLEEMQRRPAVPRRIVTRTLGLARELLADAGPDRLLHGHLHVGKVLRSPAGEWLAIDPEPLAGHPGFEVLPVLRNRVEEMGTGAAFRWSVRHRLSLVAEAAGIDEDEARAWSLLRAGVETSRATLEGGDALTTCVALTKALDD